MALENERFTAAYHANTASELERIALLILVVINARDGNFASADGQRIRARISPDFNGKIDFMPTELDFESLVTTWKQLHTDYPNHCLYPGVCHTDIDECQGSAIVYMNFGFTLAKGIKFAALAELRWSRNEEGSWLLHSYHVLRVHGLDSNIHPDEDGTQSSGSADCDDDKVAQYHKIGGDNHGMSEMRHKVRRAAQERESSSRKLKSAYAADPNSARKSHWSSSLAKCDSMILASLWGDTALQEREHSRPRKSKLDGSKRASFLSTHPGAVTVRYSIQDQIPRTPVTPVSAEAVELLYNLIKQDAHPSDESSRVRLQKRLQKLTNATQLSFAERSLLEEHNRFLGRMNSEAKVRRSTKSVKPGAARVMSFEDLERARADRAVKDAEKATKKAEKEAREAATGRAGYSEGKIKQSRKRKATLMEQDQLDPRTQAARTSEVHATSSGQIYPSEKEQRIASGHFRAPVARMW